jgi:L-fuculokinase
MPVRAIAALDIGKSHARLLVIEPASGAVVWHSTCDSTSRARECMRELDVPRLDAWLLAALADAARRAPIEAIVPVAHGAAAVLLDAAEKIVAAPDYEDPVFEGVADAYRPLRDAFSASFSPFLPLGLNLGRQWYLLQRQQPARFARVRQALLYPQYWAWRLCGVAASEVTSLGCHTDLWRPLEGGYSRLAAQQGWSALLPPLRGAHEVLGSVRPELAARTGLPADCRVLCGLHDSNASYLCHLAARTSGDPFAVISSGTWTVIMAHGASLDRLRESQDMLANVDARGAPVATARFMGGREFAAIAGDTTTVNVPVWRDFAALIAQRCLALPAFAATGGPFAGCTGRIEAAHDLSTAQRVALATLYVALMCDLQLDALGASGTVVVDGPLADNAHFAPVLAALRPGTRIERASGNAGASQAARILCGQAPAVPGEAAAAAPLDAGSLHDYRSRWRQRAIALN